MPNRLRPNSFQQMLSNSLYLFIYNYQNSRMVHVMTMISANSAIVKCTQSATEYILYFCTSPFGVSYATSSIDFKLNSEAIGNDFYSITINDEQWLQSGQLEAYLDGQWYASNATTAKENSAYSLTKLVSSSIQHGQFDSFGKLEQ